MSVIISMEKGLTLTKNVGIKILSHNLENKTMEVVLDDKIQLVVTLLEGGEDEIAALMKSNKLQVSVNGLIAAKTPSSSSSTGSTTRSGCSSYPKRPQLL